MATPKRVKRSSPALSVTAKERVRQFPDDLYEDGGILFCKFCNHSIDIVRVDKIKDHIKSQKHWRNKVKAKPFVDKSTVGM